MQSLRDASDRDRGATLCSRDCRVAWLSTARPVPLGRSRRRAMLEFTPACARGSPHERDGAEDQFVAPLPAMISCTACIPVVLEAVRKLAGL